jgi:hypothetical protein
MAAVESSRVGRPAVDPAVVVRSITVIMGTVVGLTFLFGFGNVLNLALRLGVPVWVAPLVAPAVDLSILGLLLGTRHLALVGATADVLRPARRLLIFAGVVTLALNVADPLAAGEFGKAAFDAVGPMLLIGWAEVGPGFLQAISAAGVGTECRESPGDGQPESNVRTGVDGVQEPIQPLPAAVNEVPRTGRDASQRRTLELLLVQARREYAAHRAVHQKPISADTLRIRLGIGATRARCLVKAVRAEYPAQTARDPADADTAGEAHDTMTTLVA